MSTVHASRTAADSAIDRTPAAPAWVICLALPAFVALFGVLAFAVAERAGRTPLSYGWPRNLAEAAGLGAGSEVLRMLWRGEDPNRVLTLRPEIISSSIRRATALEAAVWSRNAEVVRLLDENGAIVDAESRHHLSCLAADIGLGEVADYLRGAGGLPCVDGQAAEQVLERTRRLGDLP